MAIYTRTGDTGETALFGGGRVPKNDARVTAYGDVDELNSVIGLVRATPPHTYDALFEQVQRDLFAAGALLASPNPEKVAKSLLKAEIPEERIATFERLIDASEAKLGPLKSFVLPGGAPKAAVLHLARTVCRRAERSVVGIAPRESLMPLILQYLNRLSDLLFALAREANAEAGREDVTW